MEQKAPIEASLTRLEEIVEQLGKENVSLEESLSLFGEGMRLSQQCMEQLQEAELIVEQRGLETGKK